MLKSIKNEKIMKLPIYRMKFEEDDKGLEPTTSPDAKSEKNLGRYLILQQSNLKKIFRIE